MKVLVTGKNGQLGSELQSISDKFDQLNFTFTGSEELDITDSGAVKLFFSKNDFDFVINCAAYTAVDKAEDEPEKANAVNHLGVQNLVDNCEINNVKLIHISTDYVFDGSNNVAYKETDPVCPIGVYGKTKRLGEEVILNSSLNALIIRTSWVYSTFGNNFVKTMIRLGKEKEELGVIVDQIGTPTNANDLAKACLSILAQSNLWKKGVSIYHYSNEGAVSWYDFASEIMAIAIINCTIKAIETFEYPTKAKRPQFSVLNKKKIKNDFSLEIPNWKGSLNNCIQQEYSKA